MGVMMGCVNSPWENAKGQSHPPWCFRPAVRGAPELLTRCEGPTPHRVEVGDFVDAALLGGGRRRRRASWGVGRPG